MGFYGLIIGALGVWRVTHLLHAEDGPWNSLLRFRNAVAGGLLGSLFECFYCVSLWVAIPFAWALGSSWKEGLLLWPALSGGAVLMERATARWESGPVAYLEDQEPSHVLRQESDDHIPD